MADLTDLAKLAPTILSFLGGPAGGLAGAGIEWLADRFGASDKTKDSISNALINADPVKIKELDYDFQKFCLANGIQVQLAQIQVNAVEAASTSVFTSGWRPAVGWIGAFGMGYVAILEPIARFVTQVGFGYTGAFPVIDTSITSQVLFGILGLGAFRTAEKIKGTESNR